MYFRNSLETFGNRISIGMIKKSYSLQKRLKKYHKNSIKKYHSLQIKVNCTKQKLCMCDIFCF